MTGKAYYITTLADWQRHAARFTNSHFIVLDAPAASSVGAQHAVPGKDARLYENNSSEAAGSDLTVALNGETASAEASPATWSHCGGPAPGTACCAPTTTDDGVAAASSRRILVLIEADEGVHLSLDDDPAFEALPHPLAQKSISPAAQSALAPHGVAPGATTFDAMETLARVHPLLRHRVF